MGSSACFSALHSKGENLNEFLFVFPECFRLSKRNSYGANSFLEEFTLFDVTEKGCKNKKNY